MTVASSSARVVIDGLTKRFDRTIAVDNVSLTIVPGEIVALIGPNGAGKTTIIKTIAGLIRPTSGLVSVGGADVTRDPVTAKRSTGYIPDDPVIWGSMTGREFLRFTGALYRLSGQICDGRIAHLLPIFDLDALADHLYDDYSRGNKQKFAFLAALLVQPKVLLVDEPIVGLDPTSAHRAQELLVDFKQHGGSVLVATHTLALAERIADRIAVLASGRLMAIDTLETLRDQSGLGSQALLEDIYMAYTAHTRA